MSVAKNISRSFPLGATVVDGGVNFSLFSRNATGVDLLLDAGRTPGGPPSTIVDVTGRDARLVRPGAIAWDDVQACMPRG